MYIVNIQLNPSQKVADEQFNQHVAWFTRHFKAMVENRDIFDFELSPTEINQINQLDMGVSLYPEY